ncbi:kinesin-related protein 11-like [Dorcoceras hygrometricum]|uniref:Kinesin-related protein 11-like n=1 Tax=Dorcoceras hygrometricum TaxID=472368 RepID=A0A2Z7B9V2_9LAMI|nr:kinesin-related protein 11-like [Dorcoceras hygrometricum]
MLVRKFLESWKKNFKPGEGTSATNLQVIDMLWERHLDVLQELSKQKLAHGLLWDMTCCSAIFEGSSRDRGAVIARTNTNTPSRCWIRTMIYVNGVWTVEPCADRWVKIPQMVFSNEVPRQRHYDNTLPTTSKFFRLLTKKWADICFEVVDFCASRRLLPVGSFQFCMSLSVVEPGYRVSPRQSSVFAFRVSQFCSVFVDFSVFSWLPTKDITDFLSSIALERTVLRNVQHSVSVVHPNVQFLDQHISSPTSSEDSSMNFDNTDIDSTATAPAFSLPGSTTVSLDITKALNQLQASLDQISHRDDGAMFKDTILIHLRDIEKKQLQTQIAAATIDQIDMQREVKELNAKVDAIALNLELVKRDAEVTKEAILHQLFEFQSHTQANHIILTTQLGQLVEDLNRGGNDKKGEGVSSRGPQPSRARVLVRVERRPLPTREPSPDAQSSGQYLSAEQAAEFVSEMDRQEFDRLERERRERRQSSSSSFKRRRS